MMQKRTAKNLPGRYTLKHHFSGQTISPFPFSADITEPRLKDITQAATSKMRPDCVTTSAEVEEQPSTQGRNIYLG